MVLSTAVAKTKPATDLYGLCIGGALGFAILSIGPATGASLNPWRILGGAIVSGDLFKSSYKHAWVYYIGNPLGGLLAGLVWKLVYMTVPNEAKNEEEADNLMEKENEEEKVKL